jgi:hypothetical protein
MRYPPFCVLTSCWHCACSVTAEFAMQQNMKTTKVLGYLTLTAIVAGVLANIKDIRRYIRISTM